MHVHPIGGLGYIPQFYVDVKKPDVQSDIDDVLTFGTDHFSDIKAFIDLMLEDERCEGYVVDINAFVIDTDRNGKETIIPKLITSYKLSCHERD